MFLEEIEKKLLEIDPNVDYGVVKKSRLDTAWNYIVFNRTNINFSASKASASDVFDVHIIRENYIPEGLETQVIKKLEELPGVRAFDKPEFRYTTKPNTDTVVEMLTISFVRARKS